MKALYILLLFLTFLSCKSLKKEDIIGTYKAIDRYDGYHKIEFTDSTYNYYNRWELAVFESKGTWSIKGNKVIINSNKDHVTGYIESVEERKTDSIGYIQLKTPDGSFFIGEVQLYPGKFSPNFHDKNDRFYTDYKPIEKISIYSIQLKDSVSYMVKDTSANVFLFKIVPYDRWKYVYKDAEFKVIHNGIKSKGPKFKGLKYKKQEVQELNDSIGKR